MDHEKVSTSSRVAMTVLSVLAGLLICGVFGLQHLKGYLLNQESFAQFVVPVKIEVTGYRALPVTVMSSRKGSSEQFSPSVTYKVLEPETGQDEKGQMVLEVEEMAFESAEEARKIALGHYSVGQSLHAFAQKGDFSRVSLRKSTPSNTAKVLNVATGVVFSFALLLLWARSQFKRETAAKRVLVTGCVTLPFLAIGLIMGFSAWDAMSTNMSLDSWVQTEAVIHSRKVETSTIGSGQSRSTHYTPRVSYSFEFDQVNIQGNHLQAGIGTMYSSAEEAEAALRPYEVGAKVPVYFNPADPAQNALLKNHTGFSSIAFFGLISLFLLGSSGFALFVAGRSSS